MTLVLAGCVLGDIYIKYVFLIFYLFVNQLMFVLRIFIIWCCQHVLVLCAFINRCNIKGFRTVLGEFDCGFVVCVYMMMMIMITVHLYCTKRALCTACSWHMYWEGRGMTKCSDYVM